MSDIAVTIFAFIGGLIIGGGIAWAIARAHMPSEMHLGNAFEALASKVIRENNENFLTLAETRLKQSEQAAAATLDKKTVAIDEMIKPVKESLQKMDTQIQALEVKREGAYREVLNAVKISNDTQRQLQTGTSQLLQALHSPTARGTWCQEQLKRIFEMAGMSEHLLDFSSQFTVIDNNTDLPLRPDFVLFLTGGRCVIFDCKVPLTAYLEYSKTTDESARKLLLERHASQVREHIKALSSKEYWSHFNNSAEFVVLYMPENLLSAALDQDSELLELAIKKRIILSTQTTVLAVMWSIVHGWKEEKLRDNILKIKALGDELYTSLASMTEHIGSMGKQLNYSMESYNKMIGSLERNVFAKARRMSEYGIGKDSKAIPETITSYETQTRSLTAIESDAPGKKDVA